MVVGGDSMRESKRWEGVEVVSLILSPPTTMCLFNFFIQNDLKKSCYFFRVFENFKNA